MEDFISAYKAIEARLYDWTVNLFTNHNDLDRINSIYYYTNTEALVNRIIVSNPELGKEICLWATKWSHLNDSSENKIGLHYISKLTVNNKEVLDSLKKYQKRTIPLVSQKRTIIPYIKEYLPISCLKSIWIGPNTDQTLFRQGLDDFLKNRNLNIKIHKSRIPYRG